MITITDKTVVRSMSSEHLPVQSAKSGDVVRFITMDAMGNQWKGQSDYTIDDSLGTNPATGPLFVEGAKEGDTIKVTVLSICPTADCSMTVEPGFGVFAAEIHELKRKMFPIRDGKILFNSKLSFAIKPMIGVIGVAPKQGSVTNSDPGDHGGNMDNKDIGEGAVVYLPVFHEGALLSIGDIHALMSDGEACISGAEVPAEVVVRVEVVKRSLETIMVITDEKVTTVASDRDMAEASKRSMRAMRHFIQKELHMGHEESCYLMSLIGDMGICEAVSKLYTCRTEVPMSLFKAYDYCFERALPSI